MKHERATEEVRELAALYALGALTQHEARSFEIHLREGCLICEGELRKLEHATGGIGCAVEEIEAPEYVRDLLMARIEREPQIQHSNAEQAGRENTDVGMHAPPLHSAAPTFARPERRLSRLLPWTFAVVLALLAGYALYSWKSAQEINSSLQSQMAAAKTDVDALKQQLDTQQSQSGNLERVVEMAGKQGIRIARLKGQPATPGDTGTVFLDTQQGHCMVVGAFAPAPQGKAYQLWLSTPKEKLSIGLLPADKNGRIFTTLPMPQNIEAAAGIIVTIEPSQGSQVPTGPFCATAHID